MIDTRNMHDIITGHLWASEKKKRVAESYVVRVSSQSTEGPRPLLLPGNGDRNRRSSRSQCRPMSKRDGVWRWPLSPDAHLMHGSGPLPLSAVGSSVASAASYELAPNLAKSVFFLLCMTIFCFLRGPVEVNPGITWFTDPSSFGASLLP